MSEIRIQVQDQYLHAFLVFLQTLNYVQVDEVKSPKSGGAAFIPKDATTAALETLSMDDPLLQAIKSPRRNVTIEDLVRESGYNGTDWTKIEAIGQSMAIPQPIEELIAQLTP
jgi:hypothetical protein